MTTHEDTIEGHVKSNVSSAIDQADDCGGILAARDSYMQNTCDSVLDDGYTSAEAMDAADWFYRVFNAKAGR